VLRSGWLAENRMPIAPPSRGTGLSDRVSGVPSIEQRIDDIRAVMDAVHSERAALMGVSGLSKRMRRQTLETRVKNLALPGSSHPRSRYKAKAGTTTTANRASTVT